MSFVNYKIRRVLCVRVGRLREFWRNPIFWQQNEHNQVLFDAHGFIWLMIMCTVDWVTLLVARAASVSFRPKISLFFPCSGAATVLFSATCCVFFVFDLKVIYVYVPVLSSANLERADTEVGPVRNWPDVQI